jgi:hypothetical protein
MRGDWLTIRFRGGRASLGECLIAATAAVAGILIVESCSVAAQSAPSSRRAAQRTAPPTSVVAEVAGRRPPVIPRHRKD